MNLYRQKRNIKNVNKELDIPQQCGICQIKTNSSYVEENNGFVGIPHCNYKRFTEELYTALYASKNGYTNTAELLTSL